MSKLVEAAAEFLSRDTSTKRIQESEYRLPAKSAEARYNNVISHAKKMGYNVHHNEHMGDEESGNKGSPDITVHYERGDNRKTADPISIQVHKDGKASSDSELKGIARGK